MTTDYSTTPPVLTRHVLQLHDCPLHFWTAGNPNNLTIVMIHGATMDHRMFNPQVEALVQNYHLLVWDAPGHGESQPAGKNISLTRYAEDLLHILNSLAIQKFVVIGQSLGGYIAQHLYQLAPDSILAMMIIGSTPIARAYNLLEVWALKATLPLFDIWPYQHFTKLVANRIAVTDDVKAYAIDAIRRIPRRQFLQIWKAVTVAIDSKGIPDLHFNIPMLLVHGSHDNAGTIKRDMPLWAKELPNAEFHIIPEAGHNANQDNPAVTNTLLSNFLEKNIKAAHAG